ncbi:MAG: hypothetical protein E8D51_06665 [Nitrospira sp.]|nr:MAG: hypothetical protein E8D51_06665 [Nitrospira sp.]
MTQRPATGSATLLSILCLSGGIALALVNMVAAQVIGNEAEMDRLQGKAEEAMANEDPEGAAMNMGRAALMAKFLAKAHQEDISAVRLFQGAEPLFRSQEHSYRAMALFRRAGGQLPASSGVCGSLSLAQQSLQQALATLNDDNNTPGPVATKATQLREAATDWVTVIDSLIGDYQCR